MPFNHRYEPSKREIDVLELLKEQQRYRPADIYEDLGVNAGSAQHWLSHLNAAGWVGKPKRGLYEFRHDPRGMSDEELAEVYLEYALELDPTLLGDFNDVTTPE